MKVCSIDETNILGVKEVCIWDWDNYGCNLVGCEDSSGQCKEDVESFKYCPYCGRIIKIKE